MHPDGWRHSSWPCPTIPPTVCTRAPSAFTGTSTHALATPGSATTPTSTTTSLFFGRRPHTPTTPTTPTWTPATRDAPPRPRASQRPSRYPHGVTDTRKHGHPVPSPEGPPSARLRGQVHVLVAP